MRASYDLHNFKTLLFNALGSLVNALRLPINLHYFCHMPEVEMLINSAGDVTDPVVRILGMAAIRIDHDRLRAESNWPEPQLTLRSRHLVEIRDAIQGRINPKVSWVRPSNIERWNFTRIPYLEGIELDCKNIIETCFNSLELGKEKKLIKSQDYTGALLLGSVLDDMIGRTRYLQNIFSSLNHPLPVAVLTGDRDLDADYGETYEYWQEVTKDDLKESGIEKSAFPNKEKEMIRLILNHFNISHQIFHAPKQLGTNRATTTDTVVEWLKHRPEQGTYLVISAQPFVLYQEAVIKRTLLQQLGKDADQYQLEAVGPGVKGSGRFAHSSSHERTQTHILLDNLARIFHELFLIQHLEQDQVENLLLAAI